ncbi:TPA: hypothetical protein DCY65_00620 [Candidatus Acetothermia bacterium]|nr:hypothetical protein [Candidatus Acetothermia bacterium]HAZ30066.1 hypothetical protein [Candidatus Acetothermia bacterium]
MGRVVFAAAHLGYDTTKVPLGGGAQVAIHLLRRWGQARAFPVTVLGSGPHLEDRLGIAYRPLPWRVPGQNGSLTDLTVRGYASFCRQFEQGVTAFLADLSRDTDPRNVCVVHNDIAEAGDFATLGRMGFRQVAIFHVDVVDYAAQVYLRGKLSAPGLARAFRAVGRARVARFLPDVARLILQKQEACARNCELLVVPSLAMAEVLCAAYPWRSAADVLVLPWGTIAEAVPPRTAQEAHALRERYQLDGTRPVLVALSRISPEKGQDLLLRALRLWEKRGGAELVAFVCGKPAYMHGGSYLRRLQRLAARLKRVEVHFPGYVTGAAKHAFLSIGDLYVFPSRHESYGLTLMEALASGLPVLTTAHRSARDLVRPEFGRVVAAHPEALCRGIEALLAQRDDLSRMGAAARRFALDRPFSQAADQLTAAIQGVLARAAAPARDP